MPLTRLTCPSCSVVLTIDKPVPAGKMIRCPKCKTTFPAPGAQAPPKGAPAAAAPRSAPERPAAKAAPERRPAARPPDDEERRRRDKAPLKSNASKRSRPDEDEDDWEEDDRPRRSRRARKRGSAFPIVAGIVGSLAFLVILGCVVAATVFFMSPKNKKPDFVEQKAAPIVIHEVMPDLHAMSQARASGFDDWLQDLDAAKRKASSENKDLLVYFAGSDWSKLSKELSERILLTNRFRDIVKDTFVFVYLDFPDSAAARAKVQDSGRNERLAQSYGIAGFPTVLLADAQGKPYAAVGYVEDDMSADAYAGACMGHQTLRGVRDSYFQKVRSSQGEEKLRAAASAADFLHEHDLLGCYGTEMEQWLKLAHEIDPKNEHGLFEHLFRDELLRQMQAADPDNGEQMLRCAHLLDDWKKTCTFKDPNVAVITHLIAGHYLATAGKIATALDYLKAAQKYQPHNKRFREYLEQAADRPITTLGLSSGSGFVVGGDGLIMTNHHVIKGGGRIMVCLPQVKEPVAAEVIASDEKRDIALIRVKMEKPVGFRPLAIAAAQPLGRGEEVAAFGFPLGDQYGGGVKLTRGIVTGLPEPANHNMVLLDVKVNPGNSGGALSDMCGNVVGMVSAKSTRSDFMRVESYGMAVPAKDLQEFLAKHAKGAPAVPANTQKKPLNEVDRLVSGSVFMILKPESKLETSYGGHLTLEPRKR
jgi:S1-C subfamily serine protease/thioredoxin-related protein